MNKKVEYKEDVIEYENCVDNEILVSVSVVTYNHKKYIKDCLDGILSQKTEFKFEILLGEDNSTDETRKICFEYAQKYPNIIRLFLHSRKNVIYIDGKPTGRFNFLHNLSKAQGKYIALCEGDDYWTDPLKLQKQVDILNGDTSIFYCGHNTLVRQHSDSNKINEIQYSDWHGIHSTLSRPFNRHDFMHSWCPIHTSSFFFRNRIEFDDIKILAILNQVILGDRFLLLLLNLKGKGYFINETMSVYNMRSTGLHSSFTGNRLISNNHNFIRSVKSLDEYFNFEHHEFLNSLVLKYFDNIIYHRRAYNSRYQYYRDLLIYLLTSKYGRDKTLKKIKIVFSNIY